MKWSTVRPSVSLSDPSIRSTAATATGGLARLAAERPVGRRYRLIAGAGAQQRPLC